MQLIWQQLRLTLTVVVLNRLLRQIARPPDKVALQVLLRARLHPIPVRHLVRGSEQLLSLDLQLTPLPTAGHSAQVSQSLQLQRTSVTPERFLPNRPRLGNRSLCLLSTLGQQRNRPHRLTLRLSPDQPAYRLGSLPTPQAMSRLRRSLATSSLRSQAHRRRRSH